MEIAHTLVTGVSNFEFNSNAVQWCIESYSTMRDAIGYEDGCSASSILAIYVMCMPGVP